ncbi:MAG: hypothetical protein KGJ23_03260 [Euryarchaeota archaeon]|nr:hypothetical protein [Euryarchaeota archaeon]MDE1835617.1 hypothetical protein [Euryarchaeota archaeon]MDE1878965.1 hypothetical protein [Euryarchaeota archaeon]MDE2043761.1 hypothetical protein [Thermoplasmata archaeon]
MPQVRLGLTSSFPRPEELVAATRELDRGRRTAEEVQGLYESWTGRVVDLESRLGFSTVLGGDLGRQDLFRPFSESTPGLEVGPLTRWFETNTFFRQPIVNAPPQWAPGAFARQVPFERLLASKIAPRVILPGPYTFTALADNRTDLSRQELAVRWSELLAREVEDLSAHGVKVFQLQEPSLVVDPPSVEEESWVREAYEPLAPALSQVDSVLWTFFGDGAPVLPLLASLPVETVGVDLTDTDPTRLTELAPGKGLGLGCLDSRTTLVEDPKEIARIVRDLFDRLEPSEILLGPGTPLDLVPWEVAEKKLSVLPQVRKVLEGAPAARPRQVAPARRPAPAKRSKPPAPRARSKPKPKVKLKASSKRAPAKGGKKRR